MRLLWGTAALADLQGVAAWSLVQAEAVVNSITWMATTGFSLGHRVAGTADLFWPVPPLGAFYRIDGTTMHVLRVVDMRRRKEPW